MPLPNGGRQMKRPHVLLLIVLLVFTSSTMMADEDVSITDIEEQLTNITQEEKEVLQFLFNQVQEIERLEREKEKITAEIDTMKKGIEGLEDKLRRETISYDNKRDVLKQVLQTYQKMGPSSYIGIILDSDNLTDLLRRINTLRDLTRNTGELLDSIEEAKESLLSEKNNLAEKLKLVEEKEKQLKETLTQKQGLVKEEEEYLESLKGDKEYYIERLEYITKGVEEFKNLFSDITKEFSNIVQSGNLPEDAVNLKFTAEGLTGTIEDEAFNQMVADYSTIKDMTLHFYEGRVEMKLGEKNLLLAGTFAIDGQTLIFQPEEGSIYGMSLKKDTIEELFKEGEFVLNLEPLIGKSTLKSVEIMDGYMKLTIIPKLF